MSRSTSHYSGAMPGNLPFAALRSMYMNEANSDVARVAWREKDGKGWGESPDPEFSGRHGHGTLGRATAAVAP